MTDKERKYWTNKYRHVNLWFSHGRGWDNLTLSAAMILDGYWPSIPFWLKHLWNRLMSRNYYYTKIGIVFHKLIGDKLDPPSYKFSQIKEKFGSLCLYCISTPSSIRVLEKASYLTCEECGSNKDIGRTTTGWIKTLCKKCVGEDGDWKPIKMISTGYSTEIKYTEEKNETDRKNR